VGDFQVAIGESTKKPYHVCDNGGETESRYGVKIVFNAERIGRDEKRRDKTGNTNTKKMFITVFNNIKKLFSFNRNVHFRAPNY